MAKKTLTSIGYRLTDSARGAIKAASKKYGVSHSAVVEILSRKTAHITPEDLADLPSNFHGRVGGGRRKKEGK